jgi:hypothetical protein
MIKLVAVLYLEDDEKVVEELLEEAGIGTFSRFDMEGHGAGVPGWYGHVPTYRSRLLFTWVAPEQAQALLSAVAGARGVQDTSHPIHALQIDVESMAHSGMPPVPPAQA